MIRPHPPNSYDINSKAYHDHNRYFNEAEKIFDIIEKSLNDFPTPYDIEDSLRWVDINEYQEWYEDLLEQLQKQRDVIDSS